MRGEAARDTRRRLPSWRLLDTGASRGEFNLALDEALFGLALEGDCQPTVRFYRWSPPALSVGYFQKWEEQIDAGACERRGLRILRRITGGRAVLHRDEITYSVVCPESDAVFGRGLMPAYNGIARALAAGLWKLGVKAELAPPVRRGEGRLAARHPSCFAATSGFEISAGGRKLVGSAQKRQGGAMLQHGSILLAGHGGEFEAVMKARFRGSETPPDMTSLEEVLGFRPEAAEVTAALAKGFEDAWGVVLEEGGLRAVERARTDSLVRSKYGLDGGCPPLTVLRAGPIIRNG